MLEITAFRLEKPSCKGFFFKAVKVIPGHVIYYPAYTYKFQLKTTIGLATYFFNEFIAMSMLAKKKKRRRRNVNIHSIVFAEGNF